MKYVHLILSIITISTLIDASQNPKTLHTNAINSEKLAELLEKQRKELKLTIATREITFNSKKEPNMNYQPFFKATEDNPFIALKKMFFDFGEAARIINYDQKRSVQEKMLYQKKITEQAQNRFVLLAQKACSKFVATSDKQPLAYGPFLNLEELETLYAVENLPQVAYLGLSFQERIAQKKYTQLFLDPNIRFYFKIKAPQIIVKPIKKKQEKRPQLTVTIPQAKEIEILDYSSKNGRGLLVFKNQQGKYILLTFLLVEKNGQIDFFPGKEKLMATKPDKGILSPSQNLIALLHEDVITVYIHDNGWKESFSEKIPNLNTEYSMAFALQENVIIFEKPQESQTIYQISESNPLIEDGITHIVENHDKSYILIATDECMKLYRAITKKTNPDYEEVFTWDKPTAPNDIIILAGPVQQPNNHQNLPTIFIHNQAKNHCERYAIDKKTGTITRIGKLKLNEKIEKFLTNISGSFATIETESGKILHWNTKTDVPTPFFLKPFDEIKQLNFNGEHLFVTYQDNITIYGKNNEITPLTYLYLLIISQNQGPLGLCTHTANGEKIPQKSWLETYLPIVNKELDMQKSSNLFAIFKEKHNKKKILSFIPSNRY